MSGATTRKTTLPRTFKQARVDRGLTQEKLAAALGVRQGYISNVERGNKRPGPMFRHFVAHYFDLPVDVVAGWFSREQGKAA